MKKKRILSLFLAVMMVFLLFTEHTPYSFAEGGTSSAGGRELTKNDITEFDVAFYEDGKKLTELTKTVQVAEDFPGKIYTGLYIKADLKDVSANTANPKLKGGDILRIPIPSNVSLSKSTFKTPDVKMGDTTIGTVAVDLAPGKHDVVVTFADEVNTLNNVYVELTFRSGITVESDKQDVIFETFGIKKILKINADKKIADSGHILLKDTGNTRTSGNYGYFTYVLYVNRAGEEFDKITIKDRLQNPTTNGDTFDWDNVVFEKRTFKIEEAPSYDPTQILTLKSMSHEYRTDDSGVLKLYSGDSATANVPELAFDDADKPKSFDINIKNTGTKGFKIIYELRVPIDEVNKGFTVKNIASIVKTDTDVVLEPNRKDGKDNIINQKLSIVGSASGGGDKFGRVLIMKRDADEKGSDGKGEVISGAQFKLRHSDGTETSVISTSNGRALFKNLKLGIYEVIEVSAPVDYETVNEKKVDDVKINSAGESITKEITNPRKKIGITVHKKWSDSSSEKKDVTFTLWKHIEGLESAKQNVESKKLKKDALDDFVKFQDLYEYDGKGNKYIYTVTEEPIEGYTSKVGTLTQSFGDPTLYEVTVTNTKNPVAPPPSGGTTSPTPPTPPADGIGGMTPPPSGDDSTPPPSDGGGSGTPSKVEKITPKPPKPEEPKKEDPKPQPPADGIGGPGEPPSEPPADGVGGFEPPSEPFSGITGGGAGAGGNDTDVLPGMIPGLTGGGTGAGDPNSAVAPGHIGKLPKTGEGLNASSYALFFGFIGMSFVIYGVYMKRAKKQ